MTSGLGTQTRSSAAIRRVSSLVTTRAAPAGASFPLISTRGGFPGEKKRSLIFAEVLSIAASSSGVDIGAAPGAAAVAAPGAAETGAAEAGSEEVKFAGGFEVEDMEAVQFR